MLVTFRGIANSPIKEMNDQSMEFLLLIKPYCRVHQPTPIQVLDKTVFRKNQSPQDLAERNALRTTLLPCGHSLSQMQNCSPWERPHAENV
jgi:hypothetical protein